MNTLDHRVETLTDALGVDLPDEYMQFLKSHAAEDVRMHLSTNPDYWGLSVLFELGLGRAEVQVDSVFSLVQDAIPRFTLPVADYLSSELYLLVCHGPKRGSVVYWTHEREESDESIEEVAESFSEFLALLRHDEEDDAYIDSE